jgi:hypothetical protein
MSDEKGVPLSSSADGKQQFGDPLPSSGPLLDLIEVAPVGVAWVVGFLCGNGQTSLASSC